MNPLVDLTFPIAVGGVTTPAAALMTVILTLAVIGLVSVWRWTGDRLRALTSPREHALIRMHIDALRSHGRSEAFLGWAEREIYRAMRQARPDERPDTELTT